MSSNNAGHLIIRPSLNCNTSLHFTTLHRNTRLYGPMSHIKYSAVCHRELDADFGFGY